MSLFVKIMAAFWTLAEGLILACLRWTLIRLRADCEVQKGFLLFISIFFILLVCLLFGEETLWTYGVVQTGLPREIYTSLLWNFFCSLWVSLEGICMIYLFRGYLFIMAVLGGQKSRERNNQVSLHFGPLLLVLSMFALYGYYHLGAIGAFGRFGGSAEMWTRLSLFYIRICGLLWIVFEWAVAVILIKGYWLLRMRALLYG